MTSDQRNYPHLGQPEGLTTRQATDWRKNNTYYLRNGERVLPEVIGEPMECFTPKEWESYLATFPLGGYRLPDSPNSLGHKMRCPALRDGLCSCGRELQEQVIARQKRAVRAAACEDCLLFYQLEQRRLGRCHPPKYAITPVSRLMESEYSLEGTTDGTSTEGPRGSGAPTRLGQRASKGAAPSIDRGDETG